MDINSQKTISILRDYIQEWSVSTNDVSISSSIGLKCIKSCDGLLVQLNKERKSLKDDQFKIVLYILSNSPKMSVVSF